MDYRVFLLSRIRERFDHTGDNSESVAYGLRTTGALITGAAAIMVAIFASFAGGSLVALQQMGFGLAVPWRSTPPSSDPFWFPQR